MYNVLQNVCNVHLLHIDLLAILAINLKFIDHGSSSYELPSGKQPHIWKIHDWLVVWSNCILPYRLRLSSSQLANSYFFRAGIPPTSHVYIYMYMYVHTNIHIIYTGFVCFLVVMKWLCL